MSNGTNVVRVKANIGNVNYVAKKQAEANFNEADLWGEAAEAKYVPIIKDGKIVTDAQGKIMYSTDLMTEADRKVLIHNQKEAAKIGDQSAFSSMAVSKNKTNEIK